MRNLPNKIYHHSQRSRKSYLYSALTYARSATTQLHDDAIRRKSKFVFNAFIEYNEYIIYNLEHLDMAMLTIRNIDDSLKKQIRIRAAEHGWSMEEEVRRILQQAIASAKPRKGLGSRIHQTVMSMSGPFELELPKRSLPRAALDFSSGEA